MNGLSCPLAAACRRCADAFSVTRVCNLGRQDATGRKFPVQNHNPLTRAMLSINNGATGNPGFGQTQFGGGFTISNSFPLAAVGQSGTAGQARVSRTSIIRENDVGEGFRTHGRALDRRRASSKTDARLAKLRRISTAKSVRRNGSVIGPGKHFRSLRLSRRLSE